MTQTQKRNGNYQRKWNTLECNQYIKDNNINVQLLSEYNSITDKMKFQCSCGSIFYTTWKEFRNKKFPKQCCNKCGRRKKYVSNKTDMIKIITDYLIDNNYKCTLLSTEYLGCDKKLLFKCNCGNTFECSWSNIKKICGLCKKCSLKNKSLNTQKTLNELQKQVDSIYNNNEYVVLDRNSKYIDVRHNKCGNSFLIKISHFINGQGCKYCNKENNTHGALSNEIFLERVSIYSNDFEFLSKYKNNHTPINILHKKCKKELQITPQHIYDRGIYCKYCDGSKGEQRISNYLDTYKILYYSQFVFDDCKNAKPLRFDFYIPNYNICIEYQGEQHYTPIEIFGGEKAFKKQKENDNIKRAFCKNNKLLLVEISFNEYKNIESILNDVFKKVGDGYERATNKV